MEKLEFQNLKMNPIFEKESFVNVETLIKEDFCVIPQHHVVSDLDCCEAKQTNHEGKMCKSLKKTI
jgi:hypothetical protein